MKRLKSRLGAMLLAVSIILSLPAIAAAQQNNTEANPNQSVSEWHSFRGGSDNNALTGAYTPRSGKESALKWAYTLKDPTSWSIAVSDPVMAENIIYIAVGDQLLAITQQGQLLKSGTLAAAIEYTCRLLYADGKVFVPLSEGRLQALDAESMQQLWVTEPVITEDENGKQNHQALTTLSYADGCVYMGTAYADWVSSYRGLYQCIDAASGDIAWSYDNKNAGYYWSGAVIDNGTLYVAGDDGVLLSMNAKTGQKLAALELGAGARSTVVKNGNNILLTTVNGTLHKIEILEDGLFGTHQQVQFAASSTGTPAVYQNKAYIGGSQGEANNYLGIVCVIDLQDMRVVQSLEAPADVKSSPLVATSYENEVYAYFTANTMPGGIYALQLGKEETQPIFLPEGENANYCMASIMADAQGTLYYTNDSGKLFAIENTNLTKPSESSDTSSEQSSGTADSSSADNSSQSLVINSSATSVFGESGVAEETSNPQTGQAGKPIVSIVILGLGAGAAALYVLRKRNGFIK